MFELVKVPVPPVQPHLSPISFYIMSKLTEKIKQNMAPSFAILTLGCKVNTYESDMISMKMREAGFQEKTFEDVCDVYIVNTCTVTNIADRKSRQMLHRAKKCNPNALIVAAGCYVDAVEQGKGLPDEGVDLWVTNREKNKLTQKCTELLKQKKPEAFAVLEKSRGPEAFTYPEKDRDPKKTDALAGNDNSASKEPCGHDFLTRLDGHTRAFLKVEDGCNLFCSYCIIPYVRGRVKSRPVEDTLREVKALSKNGVTEVVLTGIHLSSMGDQLLETIRRIEQVPGILRIRLGSLEPRWITKEVVNALSACKKLCPHFHLSLQSGSDDILKKMNRRYTTQEYLEKVRMLREAFPTAAITTDIIVGFPGETEEDFLKTLEFAETVNFYEAHVFKFSRRKGTLADKMPEQIPDAVKSDRSERLIALSLKQSSDFRKKFLNSKVEFLAEEAVMLCGAPYLTGYTREYVRCMLPLDGKNAGSDYQGKLWTGQAVLLKEHKDFGEYLLLANKDFTVDECRVFE